MSDAIKRKWCRVVKIGPSVILGVTPEGERVVLARNFKCIIDAEIGDVISFIPKTPQKPPVAGPALAKYFGHDPKIIGYSVLDEEASHTPEKDEAEQVVHRS